MLYFIISLFMLINAETLDDMDKIYPYFLSVEGEKAESLQNYNGFIDNITNYLQYLDSLDYCNLEPLLGQLHNILIETMYHCDVTAPRAKTFNEAVSGRNTPDSIHYAVLMHDALLIRGIYTKFFSLNDNFYGIIINCSNTKFYWSILNPIALKTTWNLDDLLNLYKEIQDPKIDPDSSTVSMDSYREYSKEEFINKILAEIKHRKELLESTKENKLTYNFKKKFKHDNKKKLDLSQKDDKKTTKNITKLEKFYPSTAEFIISKTRYLAPGAVLLKRINNDDNFDIDKLARQYKDIFYAKDKDFKKCLDQTNTTKFYNKWLIFKYTASKKETRNFYIQIGNKKIDKLLECFTKIVKKLHYSFDKDISFTHYLYFIDK